MIYIQKNSDFTQKTVRTNKQKIVKLQDTVSIQLTLEQQRFALNESLIRDFFPINTL